MEDFRKWVYEHNMGAQGTYALSLLGVPVFIFLFNLFLLNLTGMGILWMGILVEVAAFDAGRYCLNRFLCVAETELPGGYSEISSVVRFHAFDVDKYFAGMRRKLYLPMVEIVLCTLLSAGAAAFDRDTGIVGLVAVLVVGILALFMVYFSYLWKKRRFRRELSEGTDSAVSTCLKICSVIFGIFELLGFLIGSVVASFFLWVILSGVLETAIDETQIVYRGYSSFYALVVILLALVIFVAGAIQYHRRRFRKIMFLLAGGCLVAGGIMTFVQQQRYTEVIGDKFRVYDLGMDREYTLEEVEKFRVYRDNQTGSIQLALIFGDGKTYKVIGTLSSSSDLYEQKYYSDYNFIEDYARKLLKQGAEGTLEDREALGEDARELDEKVQEGWEGILRLMG